MGERNETLRKAPAQRNVADAWRQTGKRGLPSRGLLCLLGGGVGSNLRLVDHDATLPRP
jgi:hypothetical protein